MVTLYEEKPELLQKDLERQYGRKFSKDLVRVRDNVDFALDRPELQGMSRVKRKVEISGDNLRFKTVEKKGGVAGSSTAPEVISTETGTEMITTETETEIAPEVIPQTVLGLGMAAVDEFWNSSSLASIAGEIRHQGLSKTLKYLQIETDINGAEHLLYQVNSRSGAYYISLENPRDLLKNLQEIDTKNVVDVENYWKNRAFAKTSLSESSEAQPWMEILPKLKSDVSLVSVNKEKISFERKDEVQNFLNKYDKN
jgi:hypothetical protein